MTTTAAYHNGPCVVCMTPTDTALAFRGVEEWCVAGLVALGVPMDEAIDTTSLESHRFDANGDCTVTYRVWCRAYESARHLSPTPASPLARRVSRLSFSGVATETSEP